MNIQEKKDFNIYLDLIVRNNAEIKSIVIDDFTSQGGYFSYLVVRYKSGLLKVINISSNGFNTNISELSQLLDGTLKHNYLPYYTYLKDHN